MVYGLTEQSEVKMRMLMIVYNSAINSEVMEILEKSGVENYTKWTQVQGKGKTSGTHLGTEIWPGENSVIFTATEDYRIEKLLSALRALRAKLGKEGIKAFVWELTDIT